MLSVRFPMGLAVRPPLPLAGEGWGEGALASQFPIPDSQFPIPTNQNGNLNPAGRFIPAVTPPSFS